MSCLYAEIEHVEPDRVFRVPQQTVHHSAIAEHLPTADGDGHAGSPVSRERGTHMFHDASHLAPVAVVLPTPNNPLLDDHILARRSAATGGVRLIEEDTRGWLLPALDAAFPGSLLPALET